MGNGVRKVIKRMKRKKLCRRDLHGSTGTRPQDVAPPIISTSGEVGTQDIREHWECASLVVAMAGGNYAIIINTAAVVR